MHCRPLFTMCAQSTTSRAHYYMHIWERCHAHGMVQNPIQSFAKHVRTVDDVCPFDIHQKCSHTVSATTMMVQQVLSLPGQPSVAHQHWLLSEMVSATEEDDSTGPPLFLFALI